MPRALSPVLLVLTAACSGPPRPQPRPPAPAPDATAAAPAAPAPDTSAAPSAACLADRLGTLREAAKSLVPCRDEAACREACDRGDGRSCTGLAIRYQREPDRFEETQRMFQRGCELLDPLACTNFAARFASLASATDADHACAVRLYRAACDADDPWGCGMVGKALMSGLGIAKDAAAARALLADKCRSLGSFPCYLLGAMAEHEHELELARALYARSCETGNDYACSDATRLGATLKPPAPAP